MAKTKKYLWKSTYFTIPELDRGLNKLEEKGWEIINIAYHQRTGYLIIHRKQIKN